ncbi:VOC family protein [Pararhodobacter aggregans]
MSVAGRTAPVPSGVMEAALYVDDLEATERFYAGILGLPVVLKQPGRHVFFRAGSTIVLTFLAEASRVAVPGAALPVPVHGAEGAGHLCFAATAEELDAWVAHLQAEGQVIEADFHWPNGARSIYLRDPAGNSIEFAERKLWETPA